MAAIVPSEGRASGLRRRWWLVALAVVPAVAAAAGWWFTATIDDEPAGAIAPAPLVARESPGPAPAARPSWPEGRLEGREAKVLLLAVVEDAARRIDLLPGYTATFRKRERIDGRLQPEQTLAMKVRQHPFAIYLKFLAPKAGKEVVYAQGRHGNKVIAHNGDWTRRLIPRLAVDPGSPTALAESRHPITEAGLSHLAHKLVAFRELDLMDAEAVTILDRAPGPDGRPWPRSLHLHEHPAPTRPFKRIEVFYDPETLFPTRITSYDWPASGAPGEPPLAEHYAYDDLVLDPPLTPLDFDPANPAYEFQRY